MPELEALRRSKGKCSPWLTSTHRRVSKGLAPKSVGSKVSSTKKIFSRCSAFVFVFSSENAVLWQESCCCSVHSSFFSGCGLQKKKNIVDCFVFFCGPSEQALYLPCKENKDYWSLERWTSEIPVIKIWAARLHARLDIHCSVFINIFPSLNFQHRNAAAFFLGS